MNIIYNLENWSSIILGFLTSCAYQVNCSLLFMMDQFIRCNWNFFHDKIGSITGRCSERSSSLPGRIKERGGNRALRQYSSPLDWNHVSEFVACRLFESSSTVVEKTILYNAREFRHPSHKTAGQDSLKNASFVAVFQSQLNYDIPFKSEASSVILNSTRVCNNSTRNCTRPLSRKNDGVSYMLVVAGQVDKSSNQ